MRISDWSSDVCSSDLTRIRDEHCRRGARDRRRGDGAAGLRAAAELDDRRVARVRVRARDRATNADRGAGDRRDGLWPDPAQPVEQAVLRCVRSEEHTSELQSLMRISYAVFCLKKKKTTTDACL